MDPECNFITLFQIPPGRWPAPVRAAVGGAVNHKEKMEKFLQFSGVLPTDNNEKELVSSKVAEIFAMGLIPIQPGQMPDPGKELLIAAQFYKFCQERGINFDMSCQRIESLIKALNLVGSSVKDLVQIKKIASIETGVVFVEQAKGFLELIGVTDMLNGVGESMNSQNLGKFVNTRFREEEQNGS